MSKETGLRGDVAALAVQIGDLHLRAHAEYSPVVEDLIRSGSHEISCVEHTLDGLLDFCGSDAVLQLCRRLCRHYFSFDPASAIRYVNVYWEMYGSDKRMEAGR